MTAILLFIWLLYDKSFFVLIFSVFFSFYLGYKLNLTLIPQKCPNCYGTDYCRVLQNQEIQLNLFSYFLTIFNGNLTRNVFHASVNGSEMLVFKRKVSKFPNYKIRFNMSPVHFELTPDKVQSFILCPGFTSLDFLLDPVKRDISKRRLWADIEFSIEPLLLMFYHSQGDWPVPKYYGACGDLIFEEYKGKPLINLVNADFNKRVYASVQLLKMAQKFTFDHPDFIFYFTDFSLYNLVYDSKGDIFLVDLDNVILFNKSISKEETQPKIHNSQSDGYEYSFSPKEICGHYLSDHNYFSVCKYLLSHPEEGLLRSIPKTVLDSNLNLLFLLKECEEPTELPDRISAGQKLQNLLEKMIENYKWIN